MKKLASAVLLSAALMGHPALALPPSKIQAVAREVAGRFSYVTQSNDTHMASRVAPGQRFEGDCDDLALVTLDALVAAGVNPTDADFVTYAVKGQGHAVGVVKDDRGRRIVVGDAMQPQWTRPYVEPADAETMPYVALRGQ